MSSTDEFTGLAAAYREFRPDYPEEAIRTVVASGLAAAGSARPRFVDVGAGTGIATRQLLKVAGSEVLLIALEPNDAMRQEAAKTIEAANVIFVNATAEDLPVDSGSAALVFASQAVQWFDRPRFYSEASRVLLSGGVLALLQNNRSWRDSALLAAYENLLEKWSPGYVRTYREHDYERELLGTGTFHGIELLKWSWTRRITPDAFAGMTLSSTKMNRIVKRLGLRQATELITSLIRSHAHDATELEIPYVTELFMARRNPR